MYDIEFFLSHKCLGKNRTFVCNKFAEIDIKLSKCVLLTQCLIFCSKLQIWKRTIASRPINCSWNCRTKINNTASCCNVDIGLMWVEQQRSVIWVNHRAHFPGQGHSFNHCVAKNNTSWATEAKWTGPSELEGSFLKKGSVATPKLTLCCTVEIFRADTDSSGSGPALTSHWLIAHWLSSTEKWTLVSFSFHLVPVWMEGIWFLQEPLLIPWKYALG